MSITGNKRLAIVLTVVSVVLLVLCGLLFWGYASLTLRVAMASEQTQIFEDMRTQALQSDVAGALGSLDYVVSYYPSGTKQETGSRLDRIVERERALAARDIIAYLRTKTGEDLGENAETWIQKYGKE